MDEGDETLLVNVQKPRFPKGVCLFSQICQQIREPILSHARKLAVVISLGPRGSWVTHFGCPTTTAELCLSPSPFSSRVHGKPSGVTVHKAHSAPTPACIPSVRIDLPAHQPIACTQQFRILRNTHGRPWLCHLPVRPTPRSTYSQL